MGHVSTNLQLTHACCFTDEDILKWLWHCISSKLHSDSHVLGVVGNEGLAASSKERTDWAQMAGDPPAETEQDSSS